MSKTSGINTRMSVSELRASAPLLHLPERSLQLEDQHQKDRLLKQRDELEKKNVAKKLRVASIYLFPTNRIPSTNFTTNLMYHVLILDIFVTSLPLSSGMSEIIASAKSKKFVCWFQKKGAQKTRKCSFGI